MDQEKERQREEEERAREAQKLKEIEVQKENVQKMQTTFGLESIISDIEKAKETKDYQELIAQSSKL